MQPESSPKAGHQAPEILNPECPTLLPSLLHMINEGMAYMSCWVYSLGPGREREKGKPRGNKMIYWKGLYATDPLFRNRL